MDDTIRDDYKEAATHPFTVGTRLLRNKEQLMDYMGDILVPVTEGYDHINMDMSSSWLNNWELPSVDNDSTLINFCHIFGWRKSEYLARGRLATLLNSRKSRNGNIPKLTATVITEQKQVFNDETKEKQGFNIFGFKHKRE